MGGGLMQLVAYGAQDVYLTGNPQITFFKVVYRRHTNFAIECIEQTFNGTADFGRTVTCNIARNGDLITKMYLKIELDSTDEGHKYNFVENLGNVVVEQAKVEIGGSKIDEQYGDWLNIWNELTGSISQKRGYNKMIGNDPELRKLSTNKHAYSMYVPLQFWFCRNNGLALPLIALQYHDVRVTFKFKDARECVNSHQSRNDIRFKDATLLIDYVYLDSEERKRFAQASHEYLIEQLQYTGEESVNTQSDRFRLNFNHPCKALYWALKLGKYTSGHKVVSVNDDGDVDIERFAKVVWMATRSGVQAGGEEVQVDGDDVEGAGRAKELSTGLRELAKKINAQFVFDENVAPGAAKVNAPAKLANVVLLKNECTSRDVSLWNADAIIEGLSKVAGGKNNQKLVDNHSLEHRQHSNYGLYVDGSENPVVEGKLQLNGHDRFSTRSGNYFNYVQPYEHWSNTPADGVNCYSFALNPEEHQPSGSCNMSRIDNATLLLKLGERNGPSNSNFGSEWLGDDSVIQIYTVNYNVLRIMSGMGGLAYSN